MTGTAPLLVRTCGACGTENRVPLEHLAHTGRCGRCRAGLPPVAEPIEADPALFAAIVAAATVPVLVDFWAEWCGPCRAAAPFIRSFAAEQAGRFIVLKVDADRHPDLAARHGVMGIPNFVVLRDGNVVAQQAGWSDPARMRVWLESIPAA